MYHYEEQKKVLFTDQGQRMFLRVRDRVQYLLDTSGAFQAWQAVDTVSGDSWMMLACIDRLEELDEIRCVYDECAAQNKVYIKG